MNECNLYYSLHFSSVWIELCNSNTCCYKMFAINLSVDISQAYTETYTYWRMDRQTGRQILVSKLWNMSQYNVSDSENMYLHI
jgi:hypothetical protein